MPRLGDEAEAPFSPLRWVGAPCLMFYLGVFQPWRELDGSRAEAFDPKAILDERLEAQERLERGFDEARKRGGYE